jgi:hypothetical protein
MNVVINWHWKRRKKEICQRMKVLKIQDHLILRRYFQQWSLKAVALPNTVCSGQRLRRLRVCAASQRRFG